MGEPHYDVGNLGASVVDVILHIYALPRGAQQANEGVSENRIAQMTDMRRLVGIDAGVFDQRMHPAPGVEILGAVILGVEAFFPIPLVRSHRGGDRLNGPGAIETAIDISCPGHLKAQKTLQLPVEILVQRLDEFFGDLPRSFLQPASKIEGDGKRKLTQAQRPAGAQSLGFPLPIDTFREGWTLNAGEALSVVSDTRKDHRRAAKNNRAVFLRF